MSFTLIWAKSPLQTSLAALGLTELCCFVLIAPLMHARHSAVYHWSGSTSDLFVPVFLDLLLAWASFVTFLTWSRRRTPVTHATLSIWILLAAPSVASYNRDLLTGAGMNTLTFVLLCSSLLCGGAVLLAWRFIPKLLRQAGDFVWTLMVFFGVGGVFVIVYLAWLGWEARGLNPPPLVRNNKQVGGAPARSGRILWIVFDELSFRQVYESRFRGLNLPAFDHLAAEADVFTQTVPAGIFTDRVLPSLMSGRTADLVRSSADGMLWAHDPRTELWQPFDARDTVFNDALRSGYSTRVVGWYVPYCRILRDVLDDCFWSYKVPLKNGLSSDRDLWGNTIGPFLSAASRLVPTRLLSTDSRLHSATVVDGIMHIEDYKSISNAADAVLRDPTAGFVLLHFPVPHLGGIYDRATNKFTTGPSTYLDNLALADKCLSHLREVLEESGQWDSSVVLVMGDHSWRMGPMVSDLSTLRGEELDASEGGRYDPRPVYVIKMAGQKTGIRLETPFSALNTRALLDAIMLGEIQTAESLAHFVHNRR